MVIVRENNEGEYSEIGGRLYAGTTEELAVQSAMFTRRGCDRVIRYAFELAMTRPKRHVTSATKSNGIIHSMPFWDERFAAMAAQYPDVRTSQYHIDILTAAFRPAPGLVRCGGRLESVWRHPVRSRPGDRRFDRDRARRQYQSGKGLSVDVRAGARVRAGYRGSGARQPDRAGLDRCDDAGPPRPRRRGGVPCSARSRRWCGTARC